MRNEQLEDSLQDESENEPVLKVRTKLGDCLADVRSVVKAYLEVIERPAVSASNLDKSAHQSRWTPVSAEFIADVESNVRRFMLSRPDRVELRAAWNRFLDEENPAIGDKEKRLVMGIGPIFQRNGILPQQYFRRIKRKAA